MKRLKKWALHSKMKEEIGRYLICGVMTTAINVASYTLFLKIALHYSIATSLAWVCAVIFAYITNRRFVFRSKTKEKKEVVRELSAFFLSRVSTWVMEMVGLMLLIEGVGVGELLSKYIMVVLVIIMNYVLSKVFVFNL